MRTRGRGAGVAACVSAGGALGTPARYEVSRLIHVTTDTFPWATFWTNVSGSMALGVVLVVVARRYPPSRYLRPFFATGFVGAYTTFSTVMVEAVLLVKDGRAALGAAYLLISTSAGMAAAWVGIVIGCRLPGGRPPTGHLPGGRPPTRRPRAGGSGRVPA